MKDRAPANSLADALDLSGRRVGRYLLRRRVATGGMGSIYFGHLIAVGGVYRPVAIKMIKSAMATRAHNRSMFLDEARVLSRIHHPNVCAILDFDEEGGLPYLVMEWLAGVPLSVILKGSKPEGGLPPWAIAFILAKAARGLHAAHELRDEDKEAMNVVHRDVSASNIHVLYNGGVKVIDFGIAYAEKRLCEATSPGVVKGKYGYMAPEYIQSQQVDRRADVWALGVILWEALTGRTLFKGGSPPTILTRVLSAPIPKLHSYLPDPPQALQETIDRALQRSVQERTPSALEFAEELEAYLATFEEPVHAPRLAAWLGEHFGDRKKESERMMREGLEEALRSEEIELPALPCVDEKTVPARDLPGEIPRTPSVPLEATAIRSYQTLRGLLLAMIALALFAALFRTVEVPAAEADESAAGDISPHSRQLATASNPSPSEGHLARGLH